MSDRTALYGLAAAAVIIGVTGLMLTRAGRPFSPVLLTAHKLVALAAAVVIGIDVLLAARLAPLSQVAVVATAIVGALAIAAFGTGGAISAVKVPPKALVWAHRVGGWLAIALAAWWGVLFLR